MELQQVELVASDLAFPEGPVAMADGSVLVVEIHAGRVSRVGPSGSTTVVSETGGGPNGAAIGPDGALYVCNNGGMGVVPRPPGSIQRVDLATGAAEVLYTECAGQPLKAPNDLVFDASGSFWFTDIIAGTIHYAAADGSSISCLLRGLRHPNGVGLSPDGTILYWAETATRQVWRRRIVGPGALNPSPGYTIGALLGVGSLDPWTLLVGMPGAQEFDSLAVDGAGSVCVATLVESGITVVSADGSKVERLTLPAALADRAVTNICFGGDDLRTAYLTLSETGRLVSCRWPVPGLALAFSA